MSKTILIIDKELIDYQILKERFEYLGYTVSATSNYQDGLNKGFKPRPDLIICNFQQFLLSENDISKKLAKYDTYIPIIMVDSIKKEENVLIAFDKGAVDYIIKPFNSRLVEARVKAILRRIEITKSTEEEEIKIGNLVLKPNHYEIDLKTHKVNLSKRELKLLLLLIERKVISREEIIRYIWGFDYYGGKRIVDVNICNIRRKIGDNPYQPQYIKTIKGYGYRLDDSLFKEG